MRRKLLICAAAIAIFVVIVVATGIIVFFSPLVTCPLGKCKRPAVSFSMAMRNVSPYSPIRQTSPLTAQAESFDARNGVRALRFVDAHGITARFDPWGVFIRQWRFSDIHVESGEVEIQIYEANPEETASKPWFAVFLPNRVYINRIESEHANVTWQFRGEHAGLFDTQLLITPRGRDFDYAATGGKLKMALLPELFLRRANVLITKTALTLYDIDLATNERSEGNIHGEATAGIGKDRSIDFNANLESVPIRGWLPEKEHLAAAPWAAFTGWERIPSWKIHPAKAHCAYKTRAQTTFRFWKNSRTSRAKNHSSIWS